MARTPIAAAEVAEALRSALPGMSARSHDALVRAGVAGAVQRRDRILTGETPPRLALVLDGHAGTWRGDAEGRTRLVAVAGPGELAGLRALSPARTPIELVALTPARVVTWDPDVVLGLLRTDAALAADLLELSLLAAEGLMARLDHADADGARGRVIALLWHRRELAFDPGRPLLARTQLAELAGAARDLVDRVVRELEGDGVIERTGRTGLVLHDAVALRRLAEEAEAAV